MAGLRGGGHKWHKLASMDGHCRTFTLPFGAYQGLQGPDSDALLVRTTHLYHLIRPLGLGGNFTKHFAPAQHFITHLKHEQRFNVLTLVLLPQQLAL